MIAADTLIVVVIVMPIVALIAWGVVRRRHARKAVRAALEREGYVVVRLEHRAIRQGPLSATTTRAQHVYRVVARDASGHERMAWARWGRTWLFAPDTLELHWDR